ncbi:hypothetical protein C1H46_004294 [Malus baccata]|uniref:Peptidase S8/S53 domain-containing protein n=1 Tax=Malus baccata TaxID=106549 RepID=A0A540NGG1_MALBA|nr:hypothetical protein C1H46_004294 [Malus baccata]
MAKRGRKIIGARYYNADDAYDSSEPHSPRDSIGHGSHTASTAAGREVQASYFGLVSGTARGGVPNARIAVYKVCWLGGCSSADILAAFDDAIVDGVDIISTSLGSKYPVPYPKDPIAIGSFRHENRYIDLKFGRKQWAFTDKCSQLCSLDSTVAASTIDRRFVAKAVLGNGQGFAINNFGLNGKSYPLIWEGDAANYSKGINSELASECLPETLDADKIKGKIVYYSSFSDGSDIKLAGAVGTIIVYFDTDTMFSYASPVTQLTIEHGQKVLNYIKLTKNPIATILVYEPNTDKDAMAPSISSFSSRGPNPVTPDILKPNLTASGVDILAAWSPSAPPSEDFYPDTRSIKSQGLQCHALMLVVLLAMLRLLIQIAHVLDSKKHEDLEFAYGSGHINPLKAVNPSLIFDASEADYINFLCKQGYNNSILNIITGDNSSCGSTKPGKAWDLNYPSFSLQLEDGRAINAEFPRTVTNVGLTNSTYTISSYTPSDAITISVSPTTLSFSSIGEEKSYIVKVTGPRTSNQPITSGSVVLSDGSHVVRTPLVVYTYFPRSISALPLGLRKN